MNDSLMHYGTPRHSGRYPYGSGERPFQRDGGSRRAYNTDKTSKAVEEIVGTLSLEEKRKLGIRDNEKQYLTYEEGSHVIKRILEKDGDTPVSFCDVFDEGKTATMAVATRADSNYRGKGYATKAAKKGLNWYTKNKDRLGYESLEWLTRKDNQSSMHIAKELGFEEKPGYKKLNGNLWKTYYVHSDEGGEDFMYVDNLLDRSDELMHYGTPRHSGRYPWGSGKRPFQGDGYLALPAGSSYHSGHKSTRKSKASSGSAGASKSQNSNSTDSEEAQYKRNEERRKQQKHAADMADRARKIRKEDAKEKTDKAKAEEKEREDLEDAYWKEVTNMTNQLSSIRTHAKNLKAASKPVKDVTKKMSDQQLKELTDRLKLENSYLRELNTRQGYNARPDKVENLLGLLSDVSSMGRSASKVYRTANKQRKYL